MRLSIITINFNNAAGLRRTLQSLAAQTWKNFESIIIDGGSEDESVAVIREAVALNKIPITKWLSKKDKGIYNAQNKGAKFARGQYLLFLNSGDFLYSKDTLENLAREPWDSDLVYGDIVVSYGSRRETSKLPRRITAAFLAEHTLWHPATLIKTELFKLAGPYDEWFRFCADYDFFARAILQYNASLRKSPEIVAVFNTDGAGSNPKNQARADEEREKIRKQYITPALQALIGENTELRRRMDSLSFALFAVPRFLARRLKNAFRFLLGNR